MTPFEDQMLLLKGLHPAATAERLASGAHLVSVPDFPLPDGWSYTTGTILFIAPPGYPAAQPDCFWLEPVGIRLDGGGTPAASNDSNPIPEVGQRGTWFSWHLQQWDPNRDTLVTYLNAIWQRLNPPR